VLDKACKGYPRKLDVEINGVWPLDILIPKFLTLSDHPSPKMRAHAISCLSYFVPIGSQSLLTHIDTFIACLFKHASDKDPSVQRHVRQSLVLLLESRPDRLIPEMANVAEYMLHFTKNKNKNVALEACEFWLTFTFTRDPNLTAQLRPLLPKVAPVLLDCMVYSEDDLLRLDGEADNVVVPDKETDIEPHYYGGKARESDHEGGDGQPKEKRVGAYGEGLGGEDDEDHDDDSADETSTKWNLRECAAATFDNLAVRFGQDLLSVSLEPLKSRLRSEDWLSRESGILALGAMAKGMHP